MLGADVSGLQQEMKKAQNSIAGFQASVNKIGKGVAVAMAAVTAAMTIAPAVKDAMEFEAALQQVNRQMGESANTFLEWAQNQASAFSMSKKEALQYGSVYGNLLSSMTTSQKQTMQYTTDLLKASAVISSSTGRTMQDTMERIRSGLLGETEAIEDLGIQINVAMLESTDTFRRFAGDKSWAQLDFNTQQQIRYFAILEQASKKYGNELAVNTASKQAAFVAQLNNAKLALGQAFLPIYNAVLPALTALATGLAKVTSFISQVVGALFGVKASKGTDKQTKSVQSQASAMDNLGSATTAAGKAAEKAGKKAKGSLAGFDEINSLAQAAEAAGSSGSGGSGGGAAGDIDIPNIVDESVIGGAFEKISKKARAFATKLKKIFKPVTDFFKKEWGIITKWWNKNADDMAEAWNKLWNFIKPILSWIGKEIIRAIGGAITGVRKIILGIADVFTGIINGNWKQAWRGLKGIVEGAVQTAWNVLNLLFFGKILKGIGLLTTGFKTGFTNMVRFAKDPFVNLGKWFTTKFGEIKTALTANTNGIKGAATIIWNAIKGVFGSVYTWFKNCFANIGRAIDFVYNGTTKSARAIWSGIKDVFSTLYTWFKTVFTGIGNALNAVRKSIVHVATDVWKGIKSVFGSVYTWFKTKFNGIGSALSSVRTSVGGYASKVWGAIKAPFTSVASWFKSVFDGIKSAVKSPLNWIIDGVNTLIKGLNKISFKIPSWVPGIGGNGYGISIPKIPRLARGGIVNSGQVYQAGEAGKEAIVPLENTGFVDKLASAMGTAVLQSMRMNGNSSGGSGQSVVLNIDGRTFARAVAPYMNAENKRLGTTTLKTI